MEKNIGSRSRMEIVAADLSEIAGGIKDISILAASIVGSVALRVASIGTSLFFGTEAIVAGEKHNQTIIKFNQQDGKKDSDARPKRPFLAETLGGFTGVTLMTGAIVYDLAVLDFKNTMTPVVVGNVISIGSTYAKSINERRVVKKIDRIL